MPWIARRAIGANRRSRANRRAVVRVEAIVADLAEAAERAEPEGGAVTAMWLDVVRDRCRSAVILSG
jgi:hypothetical protein